MFWSLWFVACLGSDCEGWVFKFDKPKPSQEACLKSGERVLKRMFKKPNRYSLKDWGCTNGGGNKTWAFYWGH